MKEDETIYKETKEVKKGVVIHYNPITKKVYNPSEKHSKSSNKLRIVSFIIIAFMFLLIVLFSNRRMGKSS